MSKRLNRRGYSGSSLDNCGSNRNWNSSSGRGRRYSGLSSGSGPTSRKGRNCVGLGFEENALVDLIFDARLPRSFLVVKLTVASGQVTPKDRDRDRRIRADGSAHHQHVQRRRKPVGFGLGRRTDGQKWKRCGKQLLHVAFAHNTYTYEHRESHGRRCRQYLVRDRR
jgi:hypothetical protein